MLVLLALAHAAISVVFATAASYDPDLALLGIYWANAVKCDAETVLKWDCGPACKNGGLLTNITLVHHDALEVRGFVAYHPERNYIVWSFRGTTTVLNWIEDAEFDLVNYTSHQSECGSDCRVHQGFYETYEAMAKMLMPAHRRLVAAFPNATTFITGHSLGAAQCQLALLDVLSYRPMAPVLLYDYGCPRIGNEAFASWASSMVSRSASQVYRVVHGNDPVPMVPLTDMGYVHFPHSYIWYSHTLRAPGWVPCNVSVFDEAPQCGGDFWAMNGTDHVYYLGLHMECQL